MTETKEKTSYKIDVSGKKLGRVATEIASILIGKRSVDFSPNKVSDVEVHVSGFDSMDISEKKHESSKYKRYSGYPSGQTVETMTKVVEKKGYEEVLRVAVMGMIPRNKLRKERMKRLVFEK
ncbi:50S ribosomal protein L13 [Candidatus Kaiserbacteria bacterium CG10_big_fil_rev_8_21_14_0_10_43_70]|uniref:50S ribosomal protein L13 n=1 Tax=Candidatus Kaiserbacteria bacterium CG10_big_fil_rev_8_21_14_0_10_43_70 TaxID=1974605 RepID=A0A2H0UIN5_9BACT|nr:MAG: 50S ribosomal protein L13 [Candidatus Kaiserbacteria bacterium CG10_big_fil_rev_8_21_14_0_10_43_70]